MQSGITAEEVQATTYTPVQKPGTGRQQQQIHRSINDFLAHSTKNVFRTTGLKANIVRTSVKPIARYCRTLHCFVIAIITMRRGRADTTTTMSCCLATCSLLVRTDEVRLDVLVVRKETLRVGGVLALAVRCGA